MHNNRTRLFLQIIVSVLIVGMLQGWAAGIIVFAILINILFSN